MSDTMRPWAAGPWRAEKVQGWGDTLCIVAGDSARPIFQVVKPKAYYTDFAPGSRPGSVILSDEVAAKQGRYVATPEIRRAIDAEAKDALSLAAAAPQMADALEEARTQVAILQERLGIVDTGSGTLSIIDAALAAARGQS